MPNISGVRELCGDLRDSAICALKGSKGVNREPFGQSPSVTLGWVASLNPSTQTTRDSAD